MQNTALNANWVQVASKNDTTRQAATLTLVTAPPFTLTVSPHTVNMSAGSNAATGTLTRTGDTSQPLTVNLASSDTGKVTVPGTATFAAGQATTTFGINAVNAATPYTSEQVTVTASSTTSGNLLGLDTSFGSGGVASTSLETIVQFPKAAIAVQPDGKILAASEYSGNAWQVERLNADGSVDTSFGTNGVAIATFPTTNGTSPRPTKILVQSDGKILVGGEFTTGYGTPALARYNANGTLDTTFGTNGIANVSYVEVGQSGWIVDMAERPAPDNRILLAVANSGTTYLRVAQLTPSGSPDTTFAGGAGVTSLASGGLTSAITLLPNGEFLLAGGNKIVRGLANGTLDTTFGTGGSQTIAVGNTIVSIFGAEVDSAGRIVVGVDPYNSSAGLDTFGVTRLNDDGSFDTTFAGGGTATASFSGRDNVPTSLVVQPDNKVILAGYSNISSTTRQSALARFNADGMLDGSFGTGGQYTQSLVSSPNQLIYGAALQTDGKLDVLAGWYTNLVVARYLLPSTGTSSSSSDTLTVVDDELSPPVAANDHGATVVNTALTVPAYQGVLANDTDPNGLSLTTALVAGPANGQVTLNADGSYTYTPAAGYSGLDSFTYQDSDGSLTSNTATVSLSVAAERIIPRKAIAGTLWNDANGNGQLDPGEPGISGRTVYVDQNGDGVLDNGETWTTTAAGGSYAFKGLPAGSYNIGQVLSAGWKSSPATSTDTAVTLAVGASNDFTFSELASTADQNIGVYDSSGYTVTANLNLPDQFTVFGSSNSTRYAGAPALTAYAEPTTITLKRDDGAPFTLVSMQLSTIWSSVYNVTVSFTGHKADGSLVQQSFPIGSQLGFHLVTFSGFTNVTSVTWGVSGENDYHQFNDVIVQASPSSASGVNLGSFGQPLALADSSQSMANTPLTVAVASGVLANDTDPANKPLTAVVVSQPAHGSLTLNGDGSFTYTPAAAYVGTDSFTYQDSDGTLTGNTATVGLTVVAQPPVAAGDQYTANKNLPLTVAAAQGVLVNDTDPNGLPLTASLVAGPAHGGVTLNTDGSFTYTPTATYTGPDSFTYRDSDADGSGNTATVSLFVGSAPTAVADTYAANENQTLTIAAPGLLGNDNDPNGLPLTAQITSNPASGTLTANSDGSFSYVPAANFSGTVQFSYQDSDGYLTSAPVTDTINVSPTPNGPALVSSTPSGTSSGPLGSFTLNFSEPVNAASLTSSLFTLTGPGGPVVLSASNTTISELSVTQFQVSIPTQTAPGSYTLTLGAGVADTSGNLSTQSYTASVTLAATATPTISDPGFESPSVGTGNSAYLFMPSNTGWTFNAGTGVAGNGSAFTAGNPNAPEGTQVSFLQGTGSFSQTIAGWAAGTYVISFDAAQRGNFQQSVQDFKILVDGVSVGTFTPSGTNYSNDTTGVFTVAAGPHTITFQGLDDAGGDNTAFLDAIQVVAMTLPTALLDAGFESPSVGTGNSAYLFMPSNTGWTFNAGTGVAGNGSAFTAGNPNAPEGTQVGFLQGTGSFSQTIAGWAAGTYVINFDAAQRGNHQQSVQDFKILVDGNSVGAFTPASTNYSSDTTSVFTVTAGTHTITFQGLDTSGGDNTAFVDAIQIQDVSGPVVADAGFESPSLGTGNSAYLYTPSNTGWTFGAGTGVAGNGSAFTAGNPNAPEGTQVGFLQGTGSFSQTVANWAAGSYVISFDAAERGNHQQSVQDFEILVDGISVGVFTPAGTSYSSETTGVFTVTAGPHTITFQGLDDAGGDNTAFLDAITVTPTTNNT